MFEEHVVAIVLLILEAAGPCGLQDWLRERPLERISLTDCFPCPNFETVRESRGFLFLRTTVTGRRRRWVIH
jgi:hypothetical protein